MNMHKLASVIAIAVVGVFPVGNTALKLQMIAKEDKPYSQGNKKQNFQFPK